MGVTKFTWLGSEVSARTALAENAALVAIAQDVVAGGKMYVHRLTGTLSRSIHAAPVGYEDGEGDRGSAMAGSDLGGAFGMSIDMVTQQGNGAAIWAGSWIIYAYIQEIIRGNLYMTQAVDDVSGERAQSHMTQAFAEAGLV